MTSERPVVKRTARAILLDGQDMIVIKRTKPGQQPYWITPGGGVEPDVDTSVVAALHREVSEELGAKVVDVVPAFVDTVPHPVGTDGSADVTTHTPGVGPSDTDDPDSSGNGPSPRSVKVQHFFVCRLASMDTSQRHGPEVEEPCGEYEIVRIPFNRAGIASVEVVPPSLREYLDRNIEGVRALLAPDLS